MVGVPNILWIFQDRNVISKACLWYIVYGSDSILHHGFALLPKPYVSCLPSVRDNFLQGTICSAAPTKTVLVLVPSVTISIPIHLLTGRRKSGGPGHGRMPVWVTGRQGSGSSKRCPWPMVSGFLSDCCLITQNYLVSSSSTLQSQQVTRQGGSPPRSFVSQWLKDLITHFIGCSNRWLSPSLR